MKKITRLKICNWSLLFLSVAILISGIQLEATHCMGQTSVWIHIAVGLLFMLISACHIFLHFGYSNWLAKFHRQKSHATRILWWVALVTLISGVIATFHWTSTFSHAPIGGVHGKFGFLMMIISAGHICRRLKFFKGKKYKAPPVGARRELSDIA